MKKKIIITCVITALVVATGSAVATSMMKKGHITCPECGYEITVEKPPLGERMGERKGKMPNFEEELAKKVESGEITQEEADEKLAELEENMKNRPHRRGGFERRKPDEKIKDTQE